MNFAELQQHARNIEQAQREARRAQHSRTWYPSATPATSLGYRCERRIVYQRTSPELAAPIGEELSSIFTEGKHHEKQVRAELSALGYEVVESEVNFRDKNLDITGTIDGKIGLPDESGRHGETRVPAEIKSWAGSLPTNADAMRESDGIIGRYFAQMQVYLFLTEALFGLFLFKSKMTGLWSVIPAECDPEYTEEILQRARRVRDYVIEVEAFGDESLPYRLADRSECAGCPWRDTACHPEEEGVDPLLLANDIVLRAQLARREELDTPRMEFAKIDKSLRERFKRTAGDRFVVGGADGDGHLVTKRTAKNKAITVTFSKLGDDNHG